MIVNIHQAKTHLPRLIKQAFAGEEVIIARNGKPLLKLVPLREPQGERTPGLSRGQAVYNDGFAAPPPDEIINQFEK